MEPTTNTNHDINTYRQSSPFDRSQSRHHRNSIISITQSPHSGLESPHSNYSGNNLALSPTRTIVSISSNHNNYRTLKCNNNVGNNNILNNHNMNTISAGTISIGESMHSQQN
eukprot:397189_1